MNKVTKLIIVLTLLVSFGGISVAQNSSDTEALNTLAADPSGCKTFPDKEGRLVTPRNCLFLEEPIGGKANWDLYTVKCVMDPQFKKNVCIYELWNGGSIPSGTHGPIQAVLTEDTSKPEQGPFVLLYNYIGLIYSYMSGIIIGVAVLFTVYGGIQMSMSGGDPTKFSEGKKHIVKAIEGIIVWFTISIILYTINPTFFTFL